MVNIAYKKIKQTPLTKKELKAAGVIHFMNLFKTVIEQGSGQEKHSKICNLLIESARQYPDSIVPNPGGMVSLPCVRRDEQAKPEYLSFALFEKLFTNNTDFEAVTRRKGDIMQFFNYALWYEVYFLREAEGLGRTCPTDQEMEFAFQEAKEMKKNPKSVKIQPGLAHVTIGKHDKDSLCALFKVLVREHWLDKMTTMQDWLYCFTGELPLMGNGSLKPVKFTHLNQCYFIIKHLIFGNRKMTGEEWKRMTGMFAVTNGHMINLKRSNRIPSGSNVIEPFIDKVFKV